jgi:recombinational DNA repair protein (RecF pathway)
MFETKICERCKQETDTTIMSMFNTQTICLQCKEKEEAHPAYKKARDAEHDAVVRGDYSFPGIG